MLRIAETARLPPGTPIFRLALKYPESWFAPLEQSPHADDL